MRFEHQSRARAAQRNKGILRLYAEPGSGRLLGAEMCAPAAEHMTHLLALAIERSLTVRDMLRLPFYHPVLEEGLRTALRDWPHNYPPQTNQTSLPASHSMRRHWSNSMVRANA